MYGFDEITLNDPTGPTVWLKNNGNIVSYVSQQYDIHYLCITLEGYMTLTLS